MKNNQFFHYLLSVLYLAMIASSTATANAISQYEALAKGLVFQGSGYYPTKTGLGTKKNKSVSASISTTLAVGKGLYNVELHTLSDADGKAVHEVIIDDNSLGKFTTPMKETGTVFITGWKKIEINENADLIVKSQNSTIDGKAYSAAEWTKVVLIPVEGVTLKAGSNLSVAREQEEIEAGAALVVPRQEDGDGSVNITGELKTWHEVTLTQSGPFAHEQDISPNAFLDYRMSVTFAHETGYPTYTVPGYFAADGSAAESSADQGTAWRAHLSPDRSGVWTYRVSFVKGEDAAIEPSVGEYVHPYHNKYGSFVIKKTDKKGNDFRAKGRLQYVGGRYLRHAGTGEYFLKAGPDAPETIFAYADFDNTVAMKPDIAIKTWEKHAQDAREGDPTWQSSKGKNLLGALNYLASKKVNAFSFLTYNAGGDGDNIWPYVERNGKLHFDCSKLDQWNRVFGHAQKLGLYMHFKLQENELDDNRRGQKLEPAIIKESMDGGLLGAERKLYLREIIARFSHHLALNWNLGEESTQSYEEQRDMAEYILNTDPYDHNIVIHSFPEQQEMVYRRLLGSQSVLTGASLQNSWSAAHKQSLRWIEAARAAGKPWVVANDEQGPADMGVPPDPGYQAFDGFARDEDGKYDLNDIRKYTLWGNLMAGGAGVEYYFGYRLPENDLHAQDFRSRDRSWGYAGIAIDFFHDNKIPFHRMHNMNALVGNLDGNNSRYCLGNEGEIYLVYLPEGGEHTLDLKQETANFKVFWFNPRVGGKLKLGSVKKVQGGSVVHLGSAPSDANEDWLVVLKK